jgi:hypothetical protein
MGKHNHLAVWVMIIAHQVMGFVWYSPFLFVNKWLEGQGKTSQDINTSDPMPFVYSIIGTVLACYGISWLTKVANTNTFNEALKLGLVLSFSLVFPAIAPHYKFLGLANSVLWIDLSLSLVMTTLTTIVLALWRGKKLSEV